jgi:hypothetical protein
MDCELEMLCKEHTESPHSLSHYLAISQPRYLTISPSRYAEFHSLTSCKATAVSAAAPRMS